MSRQQSNVDNLKLQGKNLRKYERHHARKILDNKGWQTTSMLSAGESKTKPSSAPHSEKSDEFSGALSSSSKTSNQPSYAKSSLSPTNLLSMSSIVPSYTPGLSKSLEPTLSDSKERTSLYPSTPPNTNVLNTAANTPGPSIISSQHTGEPTPIKSDIPTILSTDHPIDTMSPVPSQSPPTVSNFPSRSIPVEKSSFGPSSIDQSSHPSMMPPAKTMTSSPSQDFFSLSPNPTQYPSYTITKDYREIVTFSPSIEPSLEPIVQNLNTFELSYKNNLSHTPSHSSSSTPTESFTNQPTQHSNLPSFQPTMYETKSYTNLPSAQPSHSMSSTPTKSMVTDQPSTRHSNQPSILQTMRPTISQSTSPSAQPTYTPTRSMSSFPTMKKSSTPSTYQPSTQHSNQPSVLQTMLLTKSQSTSPSAQPTYTPTRSMLSFPTMEKSLSPRENSSQSPTTALECNLEAVLHYPFEDPDDAPYKGYHSSWLLIEVLDGDNEGEYCYSGNYKNATWCTYLNTGGSDSVYIGNVDDYYDDAIENDVLYDEIFTIKNVESTTLELVVKHWFFEQDYYIEYDDWNDHLLAPRLTVKNLITDKFLSEYYEGWTHPVDEDVRTHIKEGEDFVPNPDYQGDFSVIVTCSQTCVCEASNYTIL